MTKTKIKISYANSNEKICLSTSKVNKPSFVNINNQKVKTRNLYETKINLNIAYRINSYSFNYLLYQYILLFLLKTVSLSFFVYQSDISSWVTPDSSKAYLSLWVWSILIHGVLVL